MIEFIAKYWLEVLFGLIVSCIIAALKILFKKVSGVVRGTHALLRAELLRSGEKYCDKGCIPIYAKDAYDKAYQAYHDLGKNGTMDELHESVMELPIK